MASINEEDDIPAAPSCLLCRGTPEDLKPLARCRHAICRNCLTAYNQTLGQALPSGRYYCPLCPVDISSSLVDLPGNVSVVITDRDSHVLPAAKSQVAHGLSSTSDGFVSAEETHQVAHGSSPNGATGGLALAADTSQVTNSSTPSDGLVSAADTHQVAHGSSSNDGLVLDADTSQVAHGSSSSSDLVSAADTHQVAHGSSSNDGLVLDADTSQVAHGSSSNDGLVLDADISKFVHGSTSSEGRVSVAVASQVAHCSSSSSDLVSATDTHQVAHGSCSNDGLVLDADISKLVHGSTSSDGLVSVRDASQFTHGSSLSDVSFTTCESHEARGSNLDLDFRQDGLEKGRSVCLSCRYTKTIEAAADSLCEECGSLYLCRDCANVHHKNKSTANHVVISLHRRDKGCCGIHQEVINRYCGTCSQPCCNLCVLLNHGDHKIVGIGEVFTRLVDDLDHVTIEQARRSKDLRSFEGKLKSMKLSKVSERKSIVLNEIDVHAQVCIAQINKLRDKLKERVEDSYKLIQKVSECLDKIPTLAVLDETLDKANAALSEVEPHPDDIEKLISTRNEFVNCELKEEVDFEGFLDNYEQLLNNPIHFVAALPNFNIGVLEAQELSSNYRDINLCKLIYESKLAADDTLKVIPCVANLGNGYYAVAHPTLEGKPSDGIDICKIPGEFQQCFKEYADIVYDMAATPDGNLAVLSNGSTPELSCARLFHPVTGYIGSTSDFPVLNALSFDVNFSDQYIILSNHGGRLVTICNKDGTLDFAHQIDESHGVKDGSRIVCSRKYIYVLGQRRFAVYDCKNKELGLVLVATSENEFSTLTLTDISVTDFDEITVCYEGGTDDQFWFGRCALLKGSLSGWNIREMSGQARRTRLSRNHDYMVTSQEGSTVRVYEESTT